MRRFAALILLAASCRASVTTSQPAATVLLFTTVDCPVGNAFAPEINRIVAEYGSRGAAFTMVYTDPTLKADDVRRHASEFGFTSPAVLDADRALVRRHGATVTPEAVVLGRDGKRLYRGRIDDRYVAPGQYRLQPTTRDLRDALEAALAGRPPAVAETRAVGCLIESN